MVGRRSAQRAGLAERRAGGLRGYAHTIIQLTLPDGGQRDYPLSIPRWSSSEERSFVLEYVCACVFNLLSVPGGRRLTFCFDQTDQALSALLREIPDVFQVNAKKREGCGKVVSIADRICRAFGAEPFQFAFLDIASRVPAPPPPPVSVWRRWTRRWPAPR